MGHFAPHSHIVTPNGEELVVLPKAEFEKLRQQIERLAEFEEDASDVIAARRIDADIAEGKGEWLSAEEVRAALLAPTPLSFWREKRGFSQTELAKLAGISRSYMSELESGKRDGKAQLLLTLSRALRVRIEDLIVESEDAPLA